MAKFRYCRMKRGMVALTLLAIVFIAMSADAASVHQSSRSNATITVPVTLVNIQPTCDVTFSGAGLGSNGGTYKLGSLLPGDSRAHMPFKATIGCKDVEGAGEMSTALTASARGNVVTDNRIRMQLNGKTNENAPELWLETGGQRVPMDGNSAFCKGQGLNTNVCTLTPVTRVPDSSPGGKVSATVVFNVTYV
ncbi:hypothetical protein [Vagococcus sp. WN89Y]|uniref:hypothetical protein n=1 Tax=Vagococcus sp. WN89Y TaxID=3457258 RepID=UPI003FCDF9CA